MVSHIGYFLTRYGIISSIRKIIILIGIFGGKFLLIPFIQLLINKFGNFEEYYDFGNDWELAICLLLFYVLHRNLYGVPFTFKLYSLRVVLLLMESHFFLLSNTRAFDKLGLKCQNARCDDLSPQQHEKNYKKIEQELLLLESMKSKYDKPTSKNYLGYITIKSYLETLKQSYQLKLYPTPQYFVYPILYSVNQFMGCQMALIETLVKQQISNESDAYDFCERIEYSEEYIDGLLEDLRIRELEGIIPPVSIIETSIGQIDSKILSRFENSPEDYFLYKKLNQDLLQLKEKGKISQKSIDKLMVELNCAIDKYLLPSFEKLKLYLVKLKTLSKPGDGLWRSPNGDQLYNFLLKLHTNTNYTAEEIHEIGLGQVEKCKEEIVKLFSDEFPNISHEFGATLRTIKSDPRFQFSQGDKGREQIIQYYQDIISDVSNKLDDLFETIPPAKCVVERVPLFKEPESAPAYYTPPPLDKSKGGIFNVNLRNTEAHNKQMAKDLCYHEAIPGHHFQLCTAQDLKDVDAFRKIVVFTSYAEGWGLYSESLAYECGWYENKYEILGFLVAEIWRSTRLVIDTGIHSSKYKWSREQSIQYMQDNTYLDDSDVFSEVDRYIVLPGQATSYKIGQIKIIELRELAKSKLGEKFSLKKFHSAVLNNGSLPLNILEISINNWISDQLSK